MGYAIANVPLTPVRRMPPSLPHGLLTEQSDRLALFLDVDGTLIDLADRPDGVNVTHATRLALTMAIDSLGGAVALISGRTLDDLDRLFAPLRLPSAGQHGLERRHGDGRIEREPIKSGAMAEMEDALRGFVDDHPGCLLEHKGLTMALHYRRAPGAEDAARGAMMALASRFAEDFNVHDGKMVLEVKPRGQDKGTALAAFMDEAPFAGRTPVFIGDDVTDEDGFARATTMGGFGILVGERDQTAARYTVADVEAVTALLQGLT